MMRVTAMALVVGLGGAAFADATVPPVVRAREPIVIEVERPRTLVESRTAEEDTPVFDTLGFVDATVSAVEPRGGLTVIKRPTLSMKLHLRRTK